MAIVAEIVQIFRQYAHKTQVLAATIRHPQHMVSAAKAGADVEPSPFKVLKQMVQHPLTDLGIERFLADWK
jgi:transaldolase